MRPTLSPADRRELKGLALRLAAFALGGWLLLGQNLSMRESAGCALIFAAVVLSQLPLAELRRCKKGA